MYRIHLDTTTGQWLVQFLKLGLFWVSVKDTEFATYDDASAWCTDKGITTVYKRQANPIEQASWGYAQ